MVTHDERELFAARLNKALDHFGIPQKGHGRQTEAAKLFGVTQKGARKWLEGESMPALKRVPQMARRIGVRADWLLTGDGQMLPDKNQLPALPRVPIVGSLEDGPPAESPDTLAPTLGFLRIPSSDPLAYALRATSSRYHPRVRAGEVVLVEPEHEPQAGDEVVVQLQGQHLVGELAAIRGDEFHVDSLQPPHTREIYHRDQIAHIHVITGVFRAVAIEA